MGANVTLFALRASLPNAWEQTYKPRYKLDQTKQVQALY